MKISDSVRSKYNFYSWSVLVMLLILSFAALVGISVWERQLDQSVIGNTFNDKLKKYAIMALSSLLTFAINKILSYAIEILSVQEKHKTQSDRIESKAIKTIMSQAINTCFIYLVLQIIFPGNPLETFGIAPKIISLIVISGGIAELANNVLIPAYKFKEWWFQCGKCGSVREENGYVNMFQVDLNKAKEHPQYPYSDMYSYYIIYSFVISFYGYLVPSYTLVLIFLFFIHYYVDKYNLFRRFSSPIEFSQSLRNHILRAFELCVFIYAFSYFFWDMAIHFDSSLKYRILNWINLLIATVYCSLSLFNN